MKIKLLPLVAALFLFGVACTANSEPVPVSFMVFGDPAERDAYLALAAAFNESHSDIHVEVIHIPSQGDYLTRLTTEFAAGTPPDVSLLDCRRIAPFASSGAFEPIGPYLDDSDL